jgi:salicylate hydroxylase
MAPHLALIGAGITGTTLSIALTRRGIPHTVYEQAAHPTELGAGLGFGPNAARAMAIADPVLGEVFLRESTKRDVRRTVSGVAAGGGDGAGAGDKGVEGDVGEEEPVWIEFLDGTADVDVRELQPAFTVFARYGEGHGAVHRAKWLEVLMGMVPEGVIQFGKRLEGIEQSDEKVVLRFADGTMAQADAVVGCDGIKSKVREIMVGGEAVVGAKCGYSGKYAYRCMIPREQAIKELGIERVGVSSLWVSDFFGFHITQARGELLWDTSYQQLIFRMC